MLSTPLSLEDDIRRTTSRLWDAFRAVSPCWDHSVSVHECFAINHPGILFKCRFRMSTSQVEPELCSCHNIPGDVPAAGPWTHPCIWMCLGTDSFSPEQTLDSGDTEHKSLRCHFSDG